MLALSALRYTGGVTANALTSTSIRRVPASLLFPSYYCSIRGLHDLQTTLPSPCNCMSIPRHWGLGANGPRNYDHCLTTKPASNVNLTSTLAQLRRLKYIRRQLCNKNIGSNNKRHFSTGGYTLQSNKMDERTGRPITPVVEAEVKDEKPKAKNPGDAIPQPSASIILISPDNEVLLLHRVKDSSSFPSAHVFPGGNLSDQDGKIPAVGSYQRHFENGAYRRAAIRELFEESGVLLARNSETKEMINVPHLERERGRNAIHAREIEFQDWLKNQDQHAEPDIENLIPFTHWITPTGLKFARRYTTQMYLYLLPITTTSTYDSEVDFQDPTPDGDIEITSAKFLSATEWLRLARSGSVIMFPPQILLLTLISQFLDPSTPWPSDEELEVRRKELLDFIHGDHPPWTERYMSPTIIGLNPDKRLILGLDSPGRELEGSKVKGDNERVILVNFRKEGPREVEVRYKKEVMAKLDKGRL